MIRGTWAQSLTEKKSSYMISSYRYIFHNFLAFRKSDLGVSSHAMSTLSMSFGWSIWLEGLGYTSSLLF